MRFFEEHRCGICEREVPAGSIAGECSQGKVNPSHRIVIVNTAGGAKHRFLLDSFIP